MNQMHRPASTVAFWRVALLTCFLLGNALLVSGASPTSAAADDEFATASPAHTPPSPKSSDPLVSGKAPLAARSAPPTEPARSPQSSTAAASVPWRTIAFTIRTLSPSKRFEFRDRRITTAWPPTSVHDRFGVPMRIINGYRRYHPVGLATLGLKYLAAHRVSLDPRYLDRAQRIAAGLQRIGVQARGAIWFPYRFTFTMHGDPGIVNRPPWYSGMAQGLALALFVRLWEQTGSDNHRALADKTYNSLRALGRGANPWVSWVARGSYLWIEEYPQQLDRTFNGYVFALFGVYDYFQMTKDRALYSADRNASALALLRGGITTIRTFAGTFRNPGGVSDYCLAHHYRNPKYHFVHIRQLRQLKDITGDPWFGRMADLFAADVA